MSEYNGVLQDWTVDGYGRSVVWGDIYGDTKGRFPEGTWIHTSRIVEPQDLTTLKEGMIVETLNSKYLLGQPLRIESVSPQDVNV